jgi:uncharacterized MnhB-related membrane protein
MNNIQLSDILALLGPSTGNPIWNILLYIIFFCALVAMLAMPDKNLLPTLLIAGVMFAAVVAKLSTSANPPILESAEFGMLIINVIMFVFPLLAAGLLRAKKKSRVVIPAILCAVFGFVYFFMFWLTEMRPLGVA